MPLGQQQQQQQQQHPDSPADAGPHQHQPDTLSQEADRTATTTAAAAAAAAAAVGSPTAAAADMSADAAGQEEKLRRGLGDLSQAPAAAERSSDGSHAAGLNNSDKSPEVTAGGGGVITLTAAEWHSLQQQLRVRFW